MNSMKIHFWTFVHFVSASGSCQQIHLCHACVLVYMPEIMAMVFMVLCLIWRNGGILRGLWDTKQSVLWPTALVLLKSCPWCQGQFRVEVLLLDYVSLTPEEIKAEVQEGHCIMHFLLQKLWNFDQAVISSFTYFQKDGMDDNVGLAFWSDAGTNTSLWSTQRWSSSTRTTAAVGWAESNAFCLYKVSWYFSPFISRSVLV